MPRTGQFENWTLARCLKSRLVRILNFYCTMFLCTVNVWNPNMFGFRTPLHRSVWNIARTQKCLKSEQIYSKRNKTFGFQTQVCLIFVWNPNDLFGFHTFYYNQSCLKSKQNVPISDIFVSFVRNLGIM